MFGDCVFVSALSEWGWVATFSLLWFLVGIAVGGLRSAPATTGATKARPRERGGRAPQSNGNGNGRDRGRDRDVRDTRASGASSGGTGQGVELYVGNLPYETSERDLGQAFERFGRVLSVRMIENRRNGKPKGFGFVEMADDPSAEAAIKAMNGADFKGRAIVVNEAKSPNRNDR